MKLKHAREFLSAIRNRLWEPAENGGIVLTRQHAVLRGKFSTRILGKTDWEDSHNLWPTLGLNYVLDQIMGGGSAAPLYLSLYAGAVNPAAGWTAASYPGTASEITSGSEGYSETTRVQWVPAAAATGMKNNYASVATFTIVTATTLTVNGTAMHTASAKGATSGVLLSASRFATAKSFNNTDVFQNRYELDLTSP